MFCIYANSLIEKISHLKYPVSIRDNIYFPNFIPNIFYTIVLLPSIGI